MPHYIKQCPICFEQFYTERIGKIYCKKVCSNKARSYNIKILHALLDKVHKTMQLVETVPKAVKEYMEKNNQALITQNGDLLSVDSSMAQRIKLAEALDVTGLTPMEKNEIITAALKVKEDRRKKELEREFAEEDKEQAKSLIDPEMENFKL